MDKNKFYVYINLKWTNQRTAEEYRHLAKRIEKHWDGDNLTQDTINRFQTELLASCRMGRLGSLPMAFLKHYIECYEDDVEDAGMRRIKLIKPASRPLQKIAKYKFLTIDEVNDLLRAIKDPYLKVITRLMFETGLRVSEVQAIKLSDIDFGNRTIKGIGKGNKEFKVKFSPISAHNIDAWQSLGGHLHDQPFKIMFGKGMQKDKTQVHKNQRAAIWKRLSEYLKGIGYPKHVSPHQLRHSFGTYLRRNLRLDLMQIRTAMRHSSVVSTQVYVPATEEEVSEILDKRMLNKENKDDN